MVINSPLKMNFNFYSILLLELTLSILAYINGSPGSTFRFCIPTQIIVACDCEPSVINALSWPPGPRRRHLRPILRVGVGHDLPFIHHVIND